MELSAKQKEIVMTNKSEVIVIASAAAGKTTILTERIKFLLNSGIDPRKIVAITFTNAAAEELLGRVGRPTGLFIGTIHSYANYLLRSIGVDTSKWLEDEDFDMLFELVKAHPKCIKEVEHLLLDESQDSNMLQFKFLLDMVMPKNYMLVGDYRQCQPEGTKILLRGGEYKNIEDVVPGDDIVYYDPSRGRCSSLTAKTYNSIHKKVLRTSSRTFYNDNLITITSESGKQSSYTPNHRTFVKLNYYPNKQIVYLMCDSNYRFRIGQVPLFYTGDKNNRHGVNPWRTKMKNEGCEKIWIIKICDSTHEASVEENRLSYLYQIPQICWQTNKVKWTKEDINYIYKDLNTYKSAEKCLKDYGLDIHYPLLDLSIDWMTKTHFATNATVEIYASNFIPNYMSCLCFGSEEKNHSNKHYENIVKVEKKYIEKPIKVYSLETESGNYIADEIVTHNCIYRFAGARPDIILNMCEDPNVTVYNLNENYRNGSDILQYAKSIIHLNGYDYDDHSIPMRGVTGKVIEVDYSPRSIARTIKKYGNYKDWFILTRSNAQINEIIEYLRQEGVPFDTFKKAQLKNSELNKKMKEDTVKVLTVHTAKGLEAPNVIVIGVKFFNTEEKCVGYVAATRAKDLLVWATVRGKQKKKLDNWV